MFPCSSKTPNCNYHAAKIAKKIYNPKTMKNFRAQGKVQLFQYIVSKKVTLNSILERRRWVKQNQQSTLTAPKWHKHMTGDTRTKACNVKQQKNRQKMIKICNTFRAPFEKSKFVINGYTFKDLSN